MLTIISWNFDLTLIGWCLMIVMIILMFIVMMGQRPHCIWTWWFFLYIGCKPIIDNIYMLVGVECGPWSTWLMRCFVLSGKLCSAWVIDDLCWARSSGAHEYLPLCWARRYRTHEKIIECVGHEKLWSIESLAIVSLGVSYKCILALALSEELWNCTEL